MIGGQAVKSKSDHIDASPTLEILPGSAFKTKASMQNLHLYCSAVSLENKSGEKFIYALGGLTWGSHLQKTIEKYDVACNEWKVLHMRLTFTRYGRSVVVF